MENKRIGSSFDDFLVEDGRLEEATATAMNRIVAGKTEQEGYLARPTAQIFDTVSGNSAPGLVQTPSLGEANRQSDAAAADRQRHNRRDEGTTKTACMALKALGA